MREKMGGIQKKLSSKEFVVILQHLTDTIMKQQNKQHDIVTLAQLWLDYVRERQALTLYHDKQLKWKREIHEMKTEDKMTKFNYNVNGWKRP